MPVHLGGRMCDMDAIVSVAEKHGLAVVEDAAQSIGSRWKQKRSGSIGTLGCFSTHPLKNLNACGDGGFVVTSDEPIAQRIRSMRNLGIVTRNFVESFGQVSRMDTLQALILKHRLGRLSGVIETRRRHAVMYQNVLNREHVFWVGETNEIIHSYHTFVVQVSERDGLRLHLQDMGIGTAIHYPVPIHLQKAAGNLGYNLGDLPVAEKQAGRILSLPINQFLRESDILRVAELINEFVIS